MIANTNWRIQIFSKTGDRFEASAVVKALPSGWCLQVFERDFADVVVGMERPEPFPALTNSVEEPSECGHRCLDHFIKTPNCICGLE